MEQVELGGGGQLGEGVGEARHLVAGGLIAGGETPDMLGHEVVKTLVGFVFEDHALGQEAVA
jgi:hypothetical protein